MDGRNNDEKALEVLKVMEAVEEAMEEAMEEVEEVEVEVERWESRSCGKERMPAAHRRGKSRFNSTSGHTQSNEPNRTMMLTTL